jgi:hypothetical protein
VSPALGAVLFGESAMAFRERAKSLEDLGFESFSVGDHLPYYPLLPPARRSL